MSRLQILLLLLPLAVTSAPAGSSLRGADKVRATPTSRGETNGLGASRLVPPNHPRGGDGARRRASSHLAASRTSLVSVLVAGFTALRSFPAPTDVGSDLMLQAVDVTGSNETVGCHS